jgi:hypothetical protein
MENDPVEIVDLPSYKSVDLSSSFCKRLPQPLSHGPWVPHGPLHPTLPDLQSARLSPGDTLHLPRNAYFALKAARRFRNVDGSAMDWGHGTKRALTMV